MRLLQTRLREEPELLQGGGVVQHARQALAGTHRYEATGMRQG